jgi:septum formation protein
VILAADTDVVLDGTILGKPCDEQDAIAMLRALRGREHEVLTGIVVLDPAVGERWETIVSSLVRILRLTDDEIARYVATGEPMDKAGGYAIQGEAASMVESVEGCYTNVVGLPLCATAELLYSAGFPIDLAVICSDPLARRCPR